MLSAETLGASAAQTDPMRPWLAGVMLSGAISARGGFDAASGADVALRRGREIVAGHSRSGDFCGPGPGALRPSGAHGAGGLADAWMPGDVEGISEITLEPMKARSLAVYQVAIVDRNR